MELREYLRVLLKNWWMIVLLTLVGLSGALMFSYSRTPVYEATSSYVVSLASLDSASTTIYGLDTLTSNQQRIFATYCRLMDSNLVRDDAYKLMNVADPAGMTDYTSACTVVPETNVLRLVVHGPVPEMVRRLNEAIGVLGMSKAKELYGFFPLQQLDAVSVAPEPISPNHAQNASLGAILGFVLGITLALGSDYLRSPLEHLEAASIRNPKLGIYNERYFQQRLVEEINRARLRNRPLSLALMRLIPDEDFVLLPEKVQESVMRSAALWLQDHLHEGNIIAYMGGQVFGIIVPETPSDEALEFMQHLQGALRQQTFNHDAYVTSFSGRIGLVESSGGALNARQMKEKALDALDQTSPEHSIELLRTSPRPFSLSDGDGLDGMMLSQPDLVDGATD
jgi:diguanylate cyclase (GGDEF)-like protein